MSSSFDKKLYRRWIRSWHLNAIMRSNKSRKSWQLNLYICCFSIVFNNERYLVQWQHVSSVMITRYARHNLWAITKKDDGTTPSVHIIPSIIVNCSLIGSDLSSDQSQLSGGSVITLQPGCKRDVFHSSQPIPGGFTLHSQFLVASTPIFENTVFPTGWIFPQTRTVWFNPRHRFPRKWSPQQ